MKAGQLYMFSHECYSDYGVLAHVRALKDFDIDEQVERFKELERATRPEDERDDPWTHYDHSTLVDLLVSDGLVEVVEVAEVRVGEYGQFFDGLEKSLAEREARRE